MFMLGARIMAPVLDSERAQPECVLCGHSKEPRGKPCSQIGNRLCGCECVFPDTAKPKELPERITITVCPKCKAIGDLDNARCAQCGERRCEVQYVRADLATVVPLPRWQGIESAPKDGREILVWTKSQEVEKAVYLARKDGWVSPDGGYGYEPSHWMPLPSTPGAALPLPQPAEANLISAMREARLTHVHWAEHFEQHPELEKQYVETGEWDTAQEHRRWVGIYDAVIAVLASPSAGYREGGVLHCNGCGNLIKKEVFRCVTPGCGRTYHQQCLLEHCASDHNCKNCKKPYVPYALRCGKCGAEAFDCCLGQSCTHCNGVFSKPVPATVPPSAEYIRGLRAFRDKAVELITLERVVAKPLDWNKGYNAAIDDALQQVSNASVALIPVEAQPEPTLPICPQCGGHLTWNRAQVPMWNCDKCGRLFQQVQPEQEGE